MKGKATFLGHSIHPLIVPIPLGALPTALVFNALHVFTGDTAWYPPAFVATLIAALGILAAIVPGYVDYRTVVPKRGEVRQHARAHMWLGLTITALVVVSVIYHWVTRTTPTGTVPWIALGLNLLANLALIPQGYLGGGLVEDHQVGVDTPGIREEPSDTEYFPVERGGRERRRGPREV